MSATSTMKAFTRICVLILIAGCFALAAAPRSKRTTAQPLLGCYHLASVTKAPMDGWLPTRFELTSVALDSQWSKANSNAEKMHTAMWRPMGSRFEIHFGLVPNSGYGAIFRKAGAAFVGEERNAANPFGDRPARLRATKVACAR